MLMTSGDQTPVAGSGRSETAGTDAGTGQAVMAAWQVLGPLIDLVTPMALRVAATLRLADFMPDDGTGEGTVLGDLAERAGADPEALARMLRHLVQHGVFTEPRPGQFAANQTAALLRTGQPDAVWLDLDGFGGRMDLAFTGLVHTVRTGKPAWEQVFGQPFWDWLDANPAISASFDATMAVDAGNVAVADCYDWTTVRRRRAALVCSGVPDGGRARRPWAVVNEPDPLLKPVYAGFPDMCSIRSLTSVSSCLPARAEAIRQIATAMMPGISVSHTASEILTLKMTTTRTAA
jgi:hypothetical protein